MTGKRTSVTERAKRCETCYYDMGTSCGHTGLHRCYKFDKWESKP